MIVFVITRLIHTLCVLNVLLCWLIGTQVTVAAVAAMAVAGALAVGSTETVAGGAAVALTVEAPAIQVAVETAGIQGAMDRQCEVTLKAVGITESGRSRAVVADPCRDRRRVPDPHAPDLPVQDLRAPDLHAPDPPVRDLHVRCPALDHVRARGPHGATAVDLATAITATVVGSEAVVWVEEREAGSIQIVVAMAVAVEV